MEDILASIRRILSEEEPIPSSPPPPALPSAPGQPGPAEAPADDVLVLDASMMVPETAPEMPAEGPGPFSVSAPQPIIPAEASHAEPAPPDLPTPLLAPEGPVSDAPRDHESGLVGARVAESAASSIKSLVRTVASERAAPVYRGGPTVEDIVREELRPLLKEWLDTHLPPLVERLVRTEIERVVSRAAE